jgi:arsenate reductase
MRGWAIYGKRSVLAHGQPAICTQRRRRHSEIGVRHEGRSKSADEFRDVPFDVVVTVCDDAAENCPVWLGQGKRVRLGFPDPAKATGTDDEVIAVFRSVRDDIARRIPQLLKEHENG